MAKFGLLVNLQNDGKFEKIFALRFVSKNTMIRCLLAQNVCALMSKIGSYFYIIY